MYHKKPYQDDYHWLRLSDPQKEAKEKDPQTQAVFGYLEAENHYFNESTAHTKPLEKALFLEMKGRIKEQDSSVPYFKEGYWYQTQYQEGKQYPTYLRFKENLNNDPEILLAVDELAKNYDYYHIGSYSISPDNRLMIYGEDTVSRRQYTLKIKDLSTGVLSETHIPNTDGYGVWSADSKVVFYAKNHPETLRTYQVYRHVIGTACDDDVLVYQEDNEAFNVSIGKTRSKTYLTISTYSTNMTEYRILESDQPFGDFRIFQARSPKLEYSIDHDETGFYILTNQKEAVNFKLMHCREDSTNQAHWETLIPHQSSVLLEDFTLFKDFLVIEERSDGLNQIKVIHRKTQATYHLPFRDATYTAEVAYNTCYESHDLRYTYQSMTTPASVLSFDMNTHKMEILKEQEVLGGNFDKHNYRSKRLWVTARDGAKIAVSLVRHKDTVLSEETPILQYAYGAYGHTIDPNFSSVRLSLLNRGFAFAIAHVRGGEYLGRDWYEQGKKLFKKNTFNDFIDVSQHFIDEGYTSPQHLYAMGGSAGGLLMGVIANEAPKLYNGIIAAVPFVDVINTMMDKSIPLTAGEYDEWGNPNEEVYFEYIKSYSPYDNVKQQAYPCMLITTGFFDSQVQYWEPAKWIAKLRTQHRGTNKMYLYTDMESGHGGPSGRFDMLKEIAREYAFILDLESIEK